MEWLNRLFGRIPQRIPDPLWNACVARLHFLHRLSAAEQALLKSLSEKLLATKTFIGAGGFELSDEIAVLIAAQASLPVLHLTFDLYDDLHTIIVYPSQFIVPQSEVDEAGVVHEWRAPVAGEALAAGGAVVLSWEDVDSVEQGADGQNVVIHEFVHKIDMEQGDANGRPPFLDRYHRDLRADEWQLAFSAAYADFTARVDRLESQLADHVGVDDLQAIGHDDSLLTTLPLDPYAAIHPAEFFAVASEAFFVQPAPLALAYPDIFRLLRAYYRQNPLEPS